MNDYKYIQRIQNDDIKDAIKKNPTDINEDKTIIYELFKIYIADIK
jgi:hypothetical protein